MVYRSYFDIPSNNKKNLKGSSPLLTDKLVEELQGANLIFISFFLFNNEFLLKELEKLSEKGCKINIYSLPLGGYSKTGDKVYDKDFEQSFSPSKYDYAEKIYSRIEKIPNIKLNICPHTYIWSKQKYSRGDQPYSLHSKSIFARFSDDYYKCISSSCNFAVGDPPHSENLLVVENCANTKNMFSEYFYQLHKYSVSQNQYNNNKSDDKDKGYSDVQYTIKESKDLPGQNQNCYFTAPFIKYEGIGSNHYVQMRIVDLLTQAKNKIYICSQHFSDFNSFDSESLSIVKEIRKIKVLNRDIEIKVLKQTHHSDLKQPARTLATENFLKGIEGIEQKYWKSIIHDKFMIIDDQLIMTTANFTSTQFAWKENHEMEYMVSVKGQKPYKVSNTFSEINSFHFVNDLETVSAYEGHFNNLWDRAEYI
ncbi:phospholipase D-like domain-containing protein [Priestia megaterium]|uniref:phospholipase D-like domain-containing protein n=1 Tax=Priestia megaterium TaxID=1404 RepID=UPI002E221BF0|nr:phospholipase D-like domain-containing protein [Priestia megaterium]